MQKDDLKPSDKCLEITRRFEGFRASPYKCPAGVWTIGYGSTRYENGERVQPSDPPITPERADAIMLHTLTHEYAPAVNRYVQVELNQNQFDALCDFSYNCGAQNLRTSTLLKKVNAGDFENAADQFDRWIYANGKILAGLVKRRTAERILFRTPCTSTQP